jgi:hypothetical protein
MKRWSISSMIVRSIFFQRDEVGYLSLVSSPSTSAATS